MKTLLCHIKFFYILLPLMVFSVDQGYGQVTGEYRSFASGNWTNPGIWEYFDGSAWITATNYPGQAATNRAVLINTLHNITADSDITNSIGTLSINGSLILIANTANYINTLLVIVDPSSGSIFFDNKSTFNLPIDSAIQVTAGGLDGNCTNNNSIFFGPIEYAACSGQSDLGLEFDDITDAGGTGYATSNSPVCTGANNKIVLYAIPPVNGGTYTYTWYDSPAPTALSVGSGQNLIIDAPLLAGQYNYLVKMESAESGGITLYVGTVVDVVAGVPTDITFDVTQSCASASATITVASPLPSTGITYTVVGLNPFVDAVTNTTGVFLGLAPGTYALTVSNEASCASNPEVVVINPQLAKTWDGTAWSPAGAPTSSDLITINGDYSTLAYGDINACSLIVNAGFTLTIDAGNFVIIQNDLTVDGTLDVSDDGSLVMVNDTGIVTNNGVTNIHRVTTPFKKYDYTYWSTPVNTSAISSAVFPGWRINYAYEYTNNWVTAAVMTPGKGYIVMVPDPTALPGGNISEVVFDGKVNNGEYKIGSIVPSQSYLLGNPYPSALDADEFILQNSGVIGGTVYFWTHNTAIQLASNIPGTAGSGFYAYTSDDYASYNLTGGVVTAKPAISGGDAPSGKIASCQGFFTTSKASIIGANEFVFNNSMRVRTGTTSNSQFFKTKASKNNKASAKVEKHRVWLNLSNTQGAFKQTLLGYISGAVNGDDFLFDGKTLDGNKFIDFYSVNQNKNLVIQGRALPFDEKDEVPLGYKTAIDGVFTISIEKTDGILANQTVFVEDKLTNTVFNLKTGNYTFTTVKGTFNNRFVLRYSDKTLGIDDFETQAIKVLVSVKNKQIRINSLSEEMDKVTIYDLLGRLIYEKPKVSSNELSIANLISSHQVLVVKTSLHNGKVFTNKITY